jgi:hypothetical protein
MSFQTLYKPAHRQSTDLLTAAANYEAEQKRAAAAAAVEHTEDQFFSSLTEDDLMSAVGTKAAQDSRSMAASILTEWASDESADLSDLDSLIFGAVIDDEDAEADDLTDEQGQAFDELVDLIGEFVIAQGVSAKQAQNMLEDGDEKAALDVAEKIRNAISENSAEELVADFAVRDQMIMSAVTKVVRNGKVKFKRKRTRKVILNAAQKAGLRKARTRAHTAAAKAHRRKSMRVRKSRGI